MTKRLKFVGNATRKSFFAALFCIASSLAAERFESFDNEPNWEGVNNRSTAFPLRPVTQDFGFSPATQFAGGAGVGEIGGMLNPAGEAAFYGYRLPSPLDLKSPLTASGKLYVAPGPGHFLLGFFNANTLNEWRTPNSLVLRINPRGTNYHCHLEYCSSRWRAEAGVIGEIVRGERLQPVEIPTGKSFAWSLKYDPPLGGKTGVFTLKLGEWTARCEIMHEHFPDGATFTHFGILPIPKTFDSPGRAFLDDVTINSVAFDFSKDPGWDSLNNRRYYLTADTRPRFDFGFSRTQFARGKGAGELGGLVFRGDCREAARLAAYGDRIGDLTLKTKITARGKVVVLRAISDSTASIGFYHSEHSLKVNPSQKESIPSDYLGINIEGPSSEGFFFYPVYRGHNSGGKSIGSDGGKTPRIYPDAKPRDWSLTWDPEASLMTVTLDDQKCTMPLTDEDKKSPPTFNRFGICTPWVDGNSVLVFFDDLAYTVAP